ncbi:hypothetical protein MACH07_28950 [Flagellimonas marinaquae]|uniref:Glyoxalase n=2 Tax=Flavobacteriales TaxID=200644 RepID=A0AA48HKQ4_9FLAO|nr:hypothetical protein MACH07_28950 [Allomuricauda aquimarina]
MCRAIHSVILLKITAMDLESDRRLDIRPSIPESHFNNQMGFDEHFQNKTLRPVLKLQNYLLVEAFKNYANKHKGVFYDLSLEKKLQYIERAIQKDIKFRNSLKGMIIGQFTVEEYRDYITNSSALNKRMMHMVVERLKDQIQLLEAETLLQD